MFPDTVVITGEGEGVVAMDINGNIILADVANDGEVTIQMMTETCCATFATSQSSTTLRGCLARSPANSERLLVMHGAWS